MSDSISDMAIHAECAETVDGFDTDFIDTLSMSFFSLDVYVLSSMTEGDRLLVGQLQTTIKTLWPVFYQEILQAGIPQNLGLSVDGTQVWEAELTFVQNEEIQALNRDYRHKDQATDVLTFCALADHDPATIKTLLMLPEVSLGSVFISIAWARETIGDSSAALHAYVLERIFHGFLHLFGAHHDTMEDYERIKGIQDRVIAQLET